MTTLREAAQAMVDFCDGPADVQRPDVFQRRLNALRTALAEQPAPVLTLEQIDQISNGVNGVRINGWPLSQLESRRLFAERLLAAAIPPGHVVVKASIMDSLYRAKNSAIFYATKPIRHYSGAFSGIANELDWAITELNSAATTRSGAHE